MLIFLISFASALNPTQVTYAVNCGGPSLQVSGVKYSEDQHFSGGIKSDTGKSQKFKYTNTPALYQTERYALEDFFYLLPLTEPGDYVLILKFSEVWFQQPQEKLLSVKLGSITVVELLDIFDKVGRFAAYNEFIPIKFQDNKVFYRGVEAEGAFNNGYLIVDFIKTEFDNPKVNAIVLFKGVLEDTEYQAQQRILDKIQREKQDLDQDFHDSISEKCDATGHHSHGTCGEENLD